MFQTTRSRLALYILLLASWLMLTGLGGPPGVNPTPSDSDRLTQTELGTLRASYPPTVASRAAALVDMDTGRPLWSLDGDRRLPMASTTKMMTALVALEYADPDEVAEVYPRDEIPGSTAKLDAGEQYTIEELLYGALIPSGNDAATTIADHVGRKHLGGVGDEGIGAFVEAMNVRAQQMGLRNTHFTNPTGLDGPGHYSSAFDLARLGKALLKNPLLANIVATASHRVTGYVLEGRDRSPVVHSVATTNDLLGAYRGVNGIKTGTTEAAGEVLVASARRGNAGMIAVVLGSTDRFSDTRALFDWGYATHQWVQLSPAVFSSPTGFPSGRPAYTAVQRWNTDLLFALPGVDLPRYWAGTEPISLTAGAGSSP